MKRFKFWDKGNKVVDKTPTTFSFTNRTEWADKDMSNLATPNIQMKQGQELIYFGLDNLYPEKILSLYHNSPFHNSLIEFKIISGMGEGLEFIMKKNNLESKILKEKLEDKFNRFFLKKLITNKVIHNRLYFKVKNGSSDIQIINSDKIRHSTNPKYIFYNVDWGSRNNIETFLIFDKFRETDEYQIIAYNEPTIGFDSYALPSYVAASDWIYLDSKIAEFLKSNIDNSINPSAIVKFYKEFNDPDAKSNFIKDFQHHFEGARNAGKTVVLFSDGKELAPDITIADPNKLDGAFAKSQENIIKNVSYAHLINPVLLGIATTGSLGQSKEIEDAYSLYNLNYLNNLQDEVDFILNDLLKKMGYKDVEVKIKRREVKFADENKTDFQIVKK